MIIKESRVRSVARQAARDPRQQRLLKAVVTKKAALESYDVFLSHAYRDAELVHGVTEMFRRAGISVYVDWIEDPKASRASVDAATADMLRERMQRCQTLVVAYTTNAALSPWVTWELAYFDGRSGPVAVLPITPDGAAASSSGYKGREFMQLYPTIGEAKSKAGTGPHLWLNRPGLKSELVQKWVRGP